MQAPELHPAPVQGKVWSQVGMDLTAPLAYPRHHTAGPRTTQHFMASWSCLKCNPDNQKQKILAYWINVFFFQVFFISLPKETFSGTGNLITMV